jgi:hypothetical protein
MTSRGTLVAVVFVALCFVNLVIFLVNDRISQLNAKWTLPIAQHANECSPIAARSNFTAPHDRVRRLAFVDCGANMGNSYDSFTNSSNRNSPWRFPDNDTLPGQFEAYLFEVHPAFDRLLTGLAIDNPLLRAYTQTACHSKSENLTIYLDLFSAKLWGSGPFKEQNIDYAQSSNKTNVTVRGVAIGDWIKRHFSKDDYVILKLDIEGSEYAVVNHLLEVDAFPYIDQFLMEWHPQYEPLQTGLTTRQSLVARLEQAGVRNYDHHSWM